MTATAQSPVNDQIAAALAAARTKAAEVPANTNTNPVNAVVPFAPGKRRTMDDAMETVGAAVDGWISADKYGMHLEKGTINIDDFEAMIDLGKIEFPYSVRFTNSSGLTTFDKSYDGVKSLRTGQAWANVVQQAQAIDSKCTGQYDAAEVPITLLKDVLFDKSKPAKAAGSTIGYATSITGYAPFMAWLRETTAEHGKNSVVKVLVSSETTTKGNNTWGRLTFKVIA